MQALQVEERPLAGQPATVAGQLAVAADDAVAGDDDGDRVAAIGGTNCAARGGRAELGCDLAVGDGVAVGNAAEHVPYPALGRSAVEPQRHVELGERAGEVGVEL